MKRKHLKTLELIFSRPVSANVRWSEVEALLLELGARIEEREGSRVLYGCSENGESFIDHILHL